MKRSTLPLRVPIALALAVGMAGTGLAASIVVAGAGGEARAWTTNSLVANVDVADGILISRSRADSQLAARPFSSDWTDVEAGTLFCALTVAVAPGGSASVLFGDTADPALSVDCDADWRVASAGMFLPPWVSGGMATQTNRLEFLLRVDEAHGQGALAWARASRNGDAWINRTDIAPANLNWRLPLHLPGNWRSVTVRLAGAGAELLELRLKYRPDASVLQVR